MFKQRSHFPEIWQAHVTDLGHCNMTDLCLIVSDSTNQSSWCPEFVHVHQSILLPVCSGLNSLIKARSLSGSSPSIILADVTLSTLQCLLTIIYTGKCVLSCDDSDLQLLMQSLGFSESLESVSTNEDADTEASALAAANGSSDVPRGVSDYGSGQSNNVDMMNDDNLYSGSPLPANNDHPSRRIPAGSVDFEQLRGNQTAKADMIQVTPEAPESISDLNNSSSVTNGKCDKIYESVIKKLDVKIEIALKKEDTEVSDLEAPGSTIDVNNSSLLGGGKWDDIRIKKCDVKILRVYCDTDQKSCVGGHNDDADDRSAVSEYCEVQSMDEVDIKVHPVIKREKKCARKAATQFKHGFLQGKKSEGRKRVKCESNVKGRGYNLKGSKEISSSIKEHHQYINIVFQCDECDYQARVKANIARHKQTVHEGKGKTYKCELCPHVARSQASLAMHISSAHGGKSTKCNICSKVYRWIGDLKRHKQSVHEGARYSCSVCGKGFFHNRSLVAHSRAVHEKRKFPCESCDYQAPSIKTLVVHRQVQHEGKLSSPTKE